MKSSFSDNDNGGNDALKGSFYDEKNNLIVTYKSKPDGGVSVFYTMPKDNNRNFIER